MKINIKVIIALVIAVAAIGWAVTSVQQQSYSGTELTFPVGSGSVVVNNSGSSPSAARLTAASNRGAFTVNSSALDAPLVAVREGSGRNINYIADLEVPPGTTEITLVRGSSVVMSITGENSIDAVVNPLSSSESTTTLLVGVVVALAALVYASFSTKHGWLRWLRRRGGSRANATDTGAEVVSTT